jgi:hypothetical protein
MKSKKEFSFHWQSPGPSISAVLYAQREVLHLGTPGIWYQGLTPLVNQ